MASQTSTKDRPVTVGALASAYTVVVAVLVVLVAGSVVTHPPDASPQPPTPTRGVHPLSDPIRHLP